MHTTEIKFTNDRIDLITTKHVPLVTRVVIDSVRVRILMYTECK